MHERNRFELPPLTEASRLVAELIEGNQEYIFTYRLTDPFSEEARRYVDPPRATYCAELEVSEFNQRFLVELDDATVQAVEVVLHGARERLIQLERDAPRDKLTKLYRDETVHPHHFTKTADSKVNSNSAIGVTIIAPTELTTFVELRDLYRRFSFRDRGEATNLLTIPELITIDDMARMLMHAESKQNQAQGTGQYL